MSKKSISKETETNEVGGISGLIVRTQPEDIDSVTERLNQLEGVEVQMTEADGKLIVTVEEQPGQQTMVSRISDISAAEGVLSSALVYAHQE